MRPCTLLLSKSSANTRFWICLWVWFWAISGVTNQSQCLHFLFYINTFHISCSFSYFLSIPGFLGWTFLFTWYANLHVSIWKIMFQLCRRQCQFTHHHYWERYWTIRPNLGQIGWQEKDWNNSNALHLSTHVSNRSTPWYTTYMYINSCVLLNSTRTHTHTHTHTHMEKKTTHSNNHLNNTRMHRYVRQQAKYRSLPLCPRGCAAKSETSWRRW